MLKMAKTSGSLVINTLKMVHGWQNDGKQKENFYEDGNDTMCPAGCGQTETRINCIQCKARHLQYGHIKQRGEFQKPHAKLCTAKVVYECFMCIFIVLRCGDTPSRTITYF